jgi:hypothetical protein
MRKVKLIFLIIILSENLYSQNLNWLIKPIFENAADFNEGYSSCKLNGKYGLIDSTGKWIIKPVYEYCSNFSEGLCACTEDEEHYGFGYLNKDGNWVIKPNNKIFLLEVDDFKNGLAAFPNGYINRKGEGIVKILSVHSNFSCNRGRFKENSKWEFFNTKGDKIILNQYDWAWNFSSGLAAVSINNKIGFIDTLNQVVIPVIYDDAAVEFSMDIVAVKMDNKWGIIDKSNHWVYPPLLDYDRIFSFSNGLAKVYKGDKVGFINRKGALEIPLENYQDINDFQEGYCLFKSNDLYGFINKKGVIVIQPQFSDAKNIHGNFAAVKVGDKWGFIILRNKNL